MKGLKFLYIAVRRIVTSEYLFNDDNKWTKLSLQRLRIPNATEIYVWFLHTVIYTFGFYTYIYVHNNSKIG